MTKNLKNALRDSINDDIVLEKEFTYEQMQLNTENNVILLNKFVEYELKS